MSTLELKVPPPAVTLLTGVLMWLVARAAHFAAFAIPGRTEFAVGFALAGFLVSALAFFSFRRAGTTVNPTKPSETYSLVAAGTYKFTRNPMYLGLLLVLFGWAIFLSNAAAFVLLPAFVLYINRFQIEPEERALALKFGSEYGAYKAGVRRWL